MISSAKKFIFIHIPRSGGNSIQSTLVDYCDEELVKIGEGAHQFTLKHHEFNLKKHSMIRDYHAAFGDGTVTEFFKFTSVRNPWDRIMSRWFLYHYGPRNRPKSRGRSIFRRTIEPRWDKEKFIQFIEWHSDRSGPRFWSIMPWITVNGQVFIDGYIRYESIQADYDAICDRIGLPRRELPHFNRSRRESSYHAYYDGETRDLVARICKDEIEYFGFEFGGTS